MCDEGGTLTLSAALSTVLMLGQPEHVAHHLLLFLFLGLLGLGFLAVAQSCQQQLGAGRMQHADEVFGVDRACSSERAARGIWSLAFSLSAAPGLAFVSPLLFRTS